jgi:DNA repair protein RecO (recombination protein O)
VRKSAVAMFINEVLNKTVKEETHAHELCDFLIHAFIILDTQTEGSENFHLIFLLKLSRFLGFGPQYVNEVLGPRVTDEAVEKIIGQLLSADFTSSLTITHQQRREILELLVEFYTDHIETIGELKSMQVLREVMA